MGYWKMGVGLPLLNNSFNQGTRVYAELSAETTVGDGSFYLSLTDNYGSDLGLDDGLTKFLRSGDRIRIGPSSYVGYEGAFEDFVLTSVSLGLLGVSSSSNVRFASGDSVIGVGTNCPAGWIPFEQGTLTMGGITNHNLVQLTTSPGYLNRYSIQIQGSGANANGVQWDFLLDDYVPSTYYRVGGWYQMTTTSGSGYLAAGVVANAVWIAQLTTTIDASTWIELNGSVGSLSPSSAGVEFYSRIYITGTGGGGTVTANVDHFYAEHATQTDDAALGVYTFDDYPALGSRQFKILGPSKYFRLANKRLVRSSVGSDTDKRYMVSAGFKDVSTTLRDNLEVLVDWQDLGSPLVLHHDIPSVPPNLYGIMTIKDTAMGHWSGGVCSFSIEFEEL